MAIPDDLKIVMLLEEMGVPRGEGESFAELMKRLREERDGSSDDPSHS